MTQQIVIGLTGSIGMGKSTTAMLFAAEGVPVWDADEAVHRMYSTGGVAVGAIGNIYPAAVGKGFVDRDELKQWIKADPTALKQIETVVHPLIAADRADFIANTDSQIVLLDIPLLFETGLNDNVDVAIVVSASSELQRQRVLDRPNMTEEQFEIILASQMPDCEKQTRADYVVDTTSPQTAARDVQRILGDLKGRLTNA